MSEKRLSEYYEYDGKYFLKSTHQELKYSEWIIYKELENRIK